MIFPTIMCYGFQLIICKCAYHFMLTSRHRGMKEARSLVTVLQIVLLHSRHQCHNTEKYYHAEQKTQCFKIPSRRTKEDLIFCVSACSFRSICAVNRYYILISGRKTSSIPYSRKNFITHRFVKWTRSDILDFLCTRAIL